MKKNANNIILPLAFILTSLVFAIPVLAADRNSAGYMDTVSPVLCQLTSISVTGYQPAAGVTQVSVKPTISCTFSEEINVKTLAPDNFYLRDYDSKEIVSAAISYNASTRTAILTPAVPLQHGTKYSVHITDNVKGENGGSLQDKSWMFITVDRTITGTPQRPLVKVNGQYIDFVDAHPTIAEGGRTLIPFRALFEALNASVTYNSEAKKITADLNNNRITLYIDQNFAYRNDQKILLDTPPIFLNSRAYIPLRFAGEALGGKVTWDSAKFTVIITIP